MKIIFYYQKKLTWVLDLQGGSYLLLEIDIKPVINQNLQNKLISLRKSLKDKKIKYQNLKINNEKINFIASENEIKIFEDFFFNKENLINTYYNQYKSYEMEHFVTD